MLLLGSADYTKKSAANSLFAPLIFFVKTRFEFLVESKFVRFKFQLFVGLLDTMSSEQQRSRIKAVVLDVGGVLIRSPMERWRGELFAAARRRVF